MLLTMPSEEGKLVTLKSGKRLVLDFWSPSCVPCRASVPEIVRREKDVTAKGAELVLVAVLSESESVEAAKVTLKSWGVERGFLVARDSSAASEAGVADLPATYVLDSSGNLAWSAPKSATVGDVIAAIRQPEDAASSPAVATSASDVEHDQRALAHVDALRQEGKVTAAAVAAAVHELGIDPDKVDAATIQRLVAARGSFTGDVVPPDAKDGWRFGYHNQAGNCGPIGDNLCETRAERGRIGLDQMRVSNLRDSLMEARALFHGVERHGLASPMRSSLCLQGQSPLFPRFARQFTPNPLRGFLERFASYLFHSYANRSKELDSLRRLAWSVRSPSV